MNKKNNSEQKENRTVEQSSEFYNRPGSTEHNDYRINSKNKNLSANTKEEKSSYENDDKNSEAGTTGNNN